MRAVAEAVRQRFEDEILLNFSDGATDEIARSNLRCLDRIARGVTMPTGAPSGARIASAPTSSPFASSTARCMAFSSSRTLPGQRCSITCARPSRESLRAGRPFERAYLSMKNCARRGHIFAALAQRRNAQVHDVEAIEQIFAEFAGAHGWR
jgi:hypothetical protein